MNRVWIIESGDYSAYQVHAVCASEDDAQRVVEKMNAIGAGSYGDDVTYSERPVIVADDIQTVYLATVDAAWDKEHGRHRRDEAPKEMVGPLTRQVIFRQDDPGEPQVRYRDRDAEGRLIEPIGAYARASDPEVALKIARDAYAKARAEELGL